METILLPSVIFIVKRQRDFPEAIGDFTKFLAIHFWDCLKQL